MPMTSDVPEPTLYNGPIVSRNGLVRSFAIGWKFAGGFMTFAMAGLAAIHGLELGAYGLARAGDTAAATAVLTGEHLGLPGAVLFVMFLGGAALGTLTLAAAMWRSPYLPRVAAVLVVAFAVLDFAAGWGVVSHVVLLASDMVVAIALVTGYFRGSRGSVTGYFRGSRGSVTGYFRGSRGSGE